MKNPYHLSMTTSMKILYIDTMINRTAF